ncbi:hypothetical protein MiTe_04816 [Microcystis aeruginosa NIES-2520]|uniref:Uncharacterized protein n=1 Tax=Microcystis aeruginosa NIES-2520 TaxID=2303982 RepID=A0A5A5RMW8_MICAE|nr:hypothetical protein MiTe_04816 [Microcystis aeruginosa NIES-2520]
MFVLKYKVKPKPNQIEAINEAIRTTQFVRNKVLRYWMDNPGVGKTELFRFFVTWYGSIGWHKQTKSLSGKRFN